MSKRTNLEMVRKAMLQRARIEAEAAKQGLSSENMLREIKVNDGADNIYCFRLWATVVGIPPYRLEILPGMSLCLEDDGIADLARFFSWLEKNASAKRVMLSRRYSKIEARINMGLHPTRQSDINSRVKSH